MTKLNSITMRNFLSVGNVTQALKLSDHGLTLVLGSNSDSNGGVTRNGAGKTTVLQAISYAIYGQPLTKIKVDNLINNVNAKGMVVTLDFEHNNVNYRIERGRKPNILRFYIDDKEVYSDNAKGENAETQIDISNVIGMSHTMFKHIVALNTFTEPFLKLKAAEQREVIEELLGVTQISARAENLKKLILDTKDATKIESANVNAAIDANKRIELAIAEAMKRSEQWEGIRDRNIKNMRQELEQTDAIAFDEELAALDAIDEWESRSNGVKNDLALTKRELTIIEGEIERGDKELVRLEKDISGSSAQAVLARLDKEITRKEAAILSKEQEVSDFQSRYDEKQKELEKPGELDCKTCGQALEGTDHLDYVVKRLTEDRDAYGAKKATAEGQLTKLRKELDDLNAEKVTNETEAAALKTKAEARLNVLASEKENNEAARAEAAAKIEKLTVEQKTLGTKPQSLFETRDEIYEIKRAQEKLADDLLREQEKENPYKVQIDSAEALLQEISYDTLNDLQDLFKHQDFLLKLLTSKESFIRKKIIDQNLAYLNLRLGGYLDKLGLPHRVVFQSDLSVEITTLGRDFDFAQLSRGEMNRVIMATSWAFRDVWESLNHSFNLLFVDELLDSGLCAAGAEGALQILKSFGRDRKKSVFLISHRDELVGRIERTLMIKKDNGYSSFELT